jgi:hypothetical protein
MNWLTRAYRYVVDHLTKALGMLGLAFLQLMSMDPEPLRQAAQLYLPPTWAMTTAKVLFGLVILRGWYTGWRAKQAPP